MANIQGNTYIPLLLTTALPSLTLFIDTSTCCSMHMGLAEMDFFWRCYLENQMCSHFMNNISCDHKKYYFFYVYPHKNRSHDYSHEKDRYYAMQYIEGASS